uniref:Uncharacterized protein n=1 Tax=Nelumbo nucifera TaxID=4432 RepID=A0A822ZKH9_NELNU|nr:TPA_asm: hypothetical protein HUJ06_003463 [Nelumbo nucifera]
MLFACLKGPIMGYRHFIRNSLQIRRKEHLLSFTLICIFNKYLLTTLLPKPRSISPTTKSCVKVFVITEYEKKKEKNAINYVVGYSNPFNHSTLSGELYSLKFETSKLFLFLGKKILYLSRMKLLVNYTQGMPIKLGISFLSLV